MLTQSTLSYTFSIREQTFVFFRVFILIYCCLTLSIKTNNPTSSFTVLSVSDVFSGWLLSSSLYACVTGYSGYIHSLRTCMLVIARRRCECKFEWLSVSVHVLAIDWWPVQGVPRLSPWLTVTLNWLCGTTWLDNFSVFYGYCCHPARQVGSMAFRKAFLHTVVVMSSYLSSCYLPIKQSGLISYNSSPVG